MTKSDEFGQSAAPKEERVKPDITFNLLAEKYDDGETHSLLDSLADLPNVRAQYDEPKLLSITLSGPKDWISHEAIDRMTCKVNGPCETGQDPTLNAEIRYNPEINKTILTLDAQRLPKDVVACKLFFAKDDPRCTDEESMIDIEERANYLLHVLVEHDVITYEHAKEVGFADGEPPLPAPDPQITDTIDDDFEEGGAPPTVH